MSFTISGGQLAITTAQRAPAIPTLSVQLADQVMVDYATIWRTQPSVRTVVSFLSRNIAQLGLHTYRRIADTDRERLTDHPVARLLGRPNPYTTPYRWAEALVSDIGIYDNALLAKVNLTGQPQALLRLDPRYTRPIGENPFAPEGYEISGKNGKRILRPDQVIHLRGYNPEDPRWGSSPMATLRQVLAEEYQASLYREQLWRNGARTAGYLRRPAEAPEWTSAAKERFRAQWQAQYSGSGARAGGTPILEDGMEWVSAATSPRDAQYIEARKLTREEVAAAYHIPATLVGILDNATYSNITEQHKMMYQDTLGPWLTMIQQELALQLLPDFPNTADVYVEFNLQEKLRGSFEEQAVQLQTAVGAPWMTRNEARARVNLPQVDDGDELITPLNVLEGGQASPTDSAPPPEGAAELSQGAPRARLRAVEGD